MDIEKARENDTPPREADADARRNEAERAREAERPPEDAAVAPTAEEGGRVYYIARTSQFVDYAFYILYSLLTIRFMLSLLGARPDAGFVQFIHRITGPFYAPFDGIVENIILNGRYVIDLPLLIAIIVYALLHAAIIKLLRVIAHRRTTI